MAIRNFLVFRHREGISFIKHCLLGPQAQGWEVLYGRGTWLGHAEGLPTMGFGLDFSKSCPTFMQQQHDSQKLSTNPLPWAHREGISFIKHCLLGPQAQGWEVLYGRGMSENQIITNRHYYAHFSLFLCAPKTAQIAIHEWHYNAVLPPFFKHVMRDYHWQ
jgi:hypothetical protein